VNASQQPPIVPDAERSMLFFQETWLAAGLCAPQTEQWRWIPDPKRLEPFVADQEFKI
jgi:hypothetical protein